MTGTADTEAVEFHNILQIKCCRGTHKPSNDPQRP